MYTNYIFMVLDKVQLSLLGEDAVSPVITFYHTCTSYINIITVVASYIYSKMFFLLHEKKNTFNLS